MAVVRRFHVETVRKARGCGRCFRKLPQVNRAGRGDSTWNPGPGRGQYRRCAWLGGPAVCDRFHVKPGHSMLVRLRDISSGSAPAPGASSRALARCIPFLSTKRISICNSNVDSKI